MKRIILALTVVGLVSCEKRPDPAFCAKWLAYYEDYCKTWPDKCEGGPRKLARCE